MKKGGQEPYQQNDSHGHQIGFTSADEFDIKTQYNVLVLLDKFGMTC